MKDWRKIPPNWFEGKLYAKLRRVILEPCTFFLEFELRRVILETCTFYVKYNALNDVPLISWI